ncbi:MAG: MFS transporter [Rhizobiaceae bacterium]|nr:MFS transporter [Rhizobiaceae bacterium]
MQPQTTEPVTHPAPGRPWTVASALGASQIFAFGSTYYLLGVLGAPIQAETGWPLTFLSGAQSAGMLLAGLASPWVGRTIGRNGGRRVMAVSFGILGVGLLILSIATHKAIFLLGWLLMGLGMGGCLYDAAFASLGKLFGATARSPIATVTLWGGFASTVCWPLSAALLPVVGWRGICVTYALIQFLFCIPLVLWGLRGPVRAAPPVNAREALLEPRDKPIYYLLMATFVVIGLSMSVIYIHLIELLQARGLELAGAVALGALIGPSQVAARSLDLLFGGRHHPVWTFLGAMFGCAIGLVLFALDFPYLSVAIIMFSAGNGIYSIVRGALPLVLFGPEKFPTIVGLLARPGYIAYALAPSVGAVLIETAGPSRTIGILALAMICNVGLAILLAALVRRRA